MPRSRRPKHSGSWYSSNAAELDSQLQEWLDAAKVENCRHPRAIIAPHAGYSYCGHVMAYAYKHIDASKVQRVFLLGPSHHYYSSRCMLTSMQRFVTPLGDIEIDGEVCGALQQTGLFDVLDAPTDEAEHSLELHLPYICKVMQGRQFKLVPIMVGALQDDGESEYGKLLASYLDDPGNLFVVSSDFCHWGARFNYTPYDASKGAIFEYIEWLDRTAMKIIENGDAKQFQDYLKQYRNTICGRHPVAVLLQMMPYAKTPLQLRFQHYDQSSQCQSRRDSSVSYAAATATAIS